MPKKVPGASDNWRTPQLFWEKLNHQYGFTIDLCATKEDSKTERFVSKIENPFEIHLSDVAWINPPFSKAREIIPLAMKIGLPIVGIYRSDNIESKLWQDDILAKADWVVFLKGRVKYEDPSGNRQSPMFPSALWGKGIPMPTGLIGKCISLG